jgi:hypothetical protein
MIMNSFSTPSSSSAAPESVVTRPDPEALTASVPPPIGGYVPRPCLPAPDTALPSLSQNCRKSRVRRQLTIPGSAEALSMLTLLPVFTTPVPRHHIEPRAVDGSLMIHDRATSDQFVVYSPRFVSQFRAGHRAGLWYLRPATDVGVAPQSAGFRSAEAAVEALRGGAWRPQSAKTRVHDRATVCRVRWS